MEQYSDLNVHGKIKQLTTQSGRTPDNAEVVRYDTLTGRVPTPLPTAPTSAEAGKAIVVNSAGNGLEYGEAGKVDAVQINGTAIAGDGAQTKIANIPKASDSTLGVIKVGSNLSIDANGVLSGTAAANNGKLTIQDGQSTAIKAAEFTADQSGDTTLTVTGSGGTSVTGNSTTHTLTISSPSLGTGASNAAYGNHTHGNLTTDGKLGTTANKPVVTTTGGVITAGSTTSPIGMSGTSIIHETSGAASTGNTVSKGSASKSVSLTVNEWGHVTSLSDQDIEIPESKVTGLTSDLSTITGNISTINGKIPSAASSSNQLADKAFVNSSIDTNTATFRGTYNAVTDLGNTQSTVDGWTDPPSDNVQNTVTTQIAAKMTALSVTPENNDYVFVGVDQTPVGDAGEDWFWRFKYSDPSGNHSGTWKYEYTLNNSSFTADQWATINSLVTNTTVNPNDPTDTPYQGVDVKDILTHLGDSTIHVTSTDKTTWNGKQNAITGAASSITSSNLTASRVLVSDANGKVAASSSVTTTELGYLDGVTENIQTQLDTKFDTIAQDASGDYVSSIAVDGNDPSKLNVTRGTLPTIPNITIATATGSGNAITSLSASGHTITPDKGTTFLTSHQTIKQDGITGATVNRFGTCSTAAGTAAKTVTITDGTFSLEAGATVSVSFTNDNTAGSPTLSVNSTTAKTIAINGSPLSTTTGTANLLKGTCIFVYDGTYWQFIGVNNAYHKEDTSGQHALALSSAGPSSGTAEMGLDYYDRKLYYSRSSGLNIVSGSSSSTKAIIQPDWISVTNGTTTVSMSVAGGFVGNLTGDVTGNATTATTATNWSGNPFAATDVTLADM